MVLLRAATELLMSKPKPILLSPSRTKNGPDRRSVVLMVGSLSCNGSANTVLKCRLRELRYMQGYLSLSGRSQLSCCLISFGWDAFSSILEYSCNLQAIWINLCYPQSLHRRLRKISQPFDHWRWLDIICTYEVNVTVEDSTSDLPAFKATS